MRVLYLKEKSEVAIGRSLLQGRCQERGRHWGKLASGGSRDREIAPTGEVSGERSPLGEVGIYGESRDREIAPTGEVSGESRHWGKLASWKSRSGDRSYRGGVRREVAIGGSWHQGEVAIGRSLLQGRCQERGRHRGKLAFMESRDREIAPTGEVSGERSPVAIGRSLLQGSCRSRDREIAPTGEVFAIGGSWMEEVAIGRSLLQGRCQERESPLGEVHQGEVAIGRSLLQGRCQERVAIGGSWHLWRGRDREIAPTENLTEKRILRYSI